MGRSRGRRWSELIILTVMLAVAAPSAQADPITVPGYTVTDLGPVYPQVASGDLDRQRDDNGLEWSIVRISSDANPPAEPRSGDPGEFPLVRAGSRQRSQHLWKSKQRFQ